MRCPGEGAAEYTEENLVIFTGLEHIRRRPGMYIGATDARGLHHMLFELVNDSLAPEAAEPAGAVRVALGANGFVEVSDDRTPPPDLETAFGAIHTGSHGLWPYPIANALSEELTARARTPGSVYQHTFRRGVTHAALQSGGPPDGRGLTVRFRPDPDIFGAAQFDPNAVRDRLRQCAFLHSGVRITLTDEANDIEDVFEFADGVASYVTWLNATRTPLHPEPIVLRGEADGVRYEVALQWCAEDEEVCVSAANGWVTSNGGTHVSGLQNGCNRALRELVREHAPGWSEPQGDELRRGLTAVIVVRMPQPMFETQSRSRLNGSEVERIVRSGLYKSLRDHLSANTELEKRIVRAAIASGGRK